MICVRMRVVVQKREGKSMMVRERMIMTFDGLVLAKVLMVLTLSTRILIFVKITRVGVTIVEEENNIQQHH